MVRIQDDTDRTPPLAKHHTMEDAGQKLRRARERLNLRVRDVEIASQKIAEKHKNDEFAVLINRVSEIENRGLVPTLYKLYSLCVIYGLDYLEVLEWYGISLSSMPADALLAEIPSTHAVSFQSGDQGEMMFPLSIEPGVDWRKTVYLSRVIQRWGKLPMLMLNGLDVKDRRYGFVGTEDWFMYPLLAPGSLVVIDDTRRKLSTEPWINEFERPIYFLEGRNGHRCAWCSLAGDKLILEPHPSSNCAAEVYEYPKEIEIIGQVTGVAMSLGQGPKRRTRS